MVIPVRSILSFSCILVFAMFFACAPIKSTWTSEPEFKSVSNSYYEAEIEPVKNGNNYYVTFRLDVTNKTDEELKINWNKTIFINNRKAQGTFVFEGINPEDIRNLTVPDEIIPAGAKVSKIIAPFKYIARAPVASSSERGLHAGMLPNGENGIDLVVKSLTGDITERLTVNIRENKSK